MRNDSKVKIFWDALKDEMYSEDGKQAVNDFASKLQAQKLVMFWSDLWDIDREKMMSFCDKNEFDIAWISTIEKAAKRSFKNPALLPATLLKGNLDSPASSTQSKGIAGFRPPKLCTPGMLHLAWPVSTPPMNSG